MQIDELIARIAAGEAAFDEVEVSEGSLAGFTLRRLSLRRARLVGIDLRGTDLTGVDLHGAHLDSVDLRGAHLFRANLSSRFVDLEGVRERPGG
jgi:uncharacterized protein YjbI with pentapeptide repeats